MVAVQTVRAVGGDEPPITLTVLQAPDDLRRLPAAATDLGVITNYSLACATDAAWQAAWLPQFARCGRSTTLFDRSILNGARQLLRIDDDFRYSLIRVRVSDEQAFVLCMRLGNDPLLLAPCGYTAGRSLTSWIHQMSNGRLLPDIAVLGDDRDDVVPVVVEHLVRDESVIGFWP
ncbi:hypothetical protein [Embleya sp. NPDC005575]|uniref:hypothetical protein n=1 Tax=Embleya sp. NPDC005575 TaxID=3156892 RepID=UPI0033A68662